MINAIREHENLTLRSTKIITISTQAVVQSTIPYSVDPKWAKSWLHLEYPVDEEVFYDLLYQTGFETAYGKAIA